MKTIPHDLVIIGGGPGGYVASLRAAQLGLNTAVIESEGALGGTCLRVGCIPSKALLESSHLFAQAGKDFARHGIRTGSLELDLAAMLQRKDRVVSTLSKGIEGLLKKNKVTRYLGHGSLEGKGKVLVKGSEGEQTLQAKDIVIATGSKPASLPGVELDGDRVGTSTEALSYPEVPGHLVVIGAGYIGLELGSVWLRLGARVTVVEYLDRILPGMDLDLAQAAQKLFERQGLKFLLGRKVTGATAQDPSCRVECEGEDPIQCDRVLMAVGRLPQTEGLNLEAAGVKADQRGRIEVSNGFRTSAANVYAIGDVIPGPMLAHKAEEEGVAVAEQIVNGQGHVNYDTIPGVAYTHPEIASVGMTEDALKAAGRPYNKGQFSYRANGRAQAILETDGFAKVLADPKTDRVLGVHILGAHAGDLINEAAVAMSFGASSEDLATACHAHPTLGEVLKEAALDTTGRVLHS